MRGKQATKRKITPDVKYSNVQVAKFINYLMIDGKKSLAQKIMYDALDIVEKKTKEKPIEVFEKAVRNVSPVLEVKGRRIGGATYQIPVHVRVDRRFILAAKWLIEAARKRKGQPMQVKLASEFMDAANETGSAMKKKYEVQKVAEANKAFSHFARY